MQDAGRDILWRVYLLYALVLIFAIAVLVRIAIIQYSIGDTLIAESEKQELKVFSLEALRGNILADDGSLLATSVPVFEIRMDVSSPHIDDALFNSKVDSLATKLADLFKNKSAREYARELREGRREGNRYLLIKNKVTYAELKKMRKFPILNRGKYRGGLIVEQHEKREKPFKELASRTIGYENNRENIFVGLEGAFHDDLKGINGKQLKRRINNGDWIPVFDAGEIDPQNGKDVVTTIDVNLQDVAENALRRNLVENEAFQGCAVLMEVETGHIKAIANLTRDKKTGRYEESYNYAVAESVEPGSTFKLASMIALLEENKVRLTDSMRIGNGQMVYHNRVMKDVYPIRNGRITVREAFEKSSNVAISKLVTDAFGKNPEKYVDHLYALSINQPLKIEIPGEGKPYIKHPKNKQYWYGTTLPWMSIGYESQLTPLQILTLYNAVANNGKMVKPMFVEEISQGGVVIRKFATETINESIASQYTIDQLKSLLEGVVEHGTGKALKDSPVKIAGKTGTAQIASGKSGYNKQNYNASFVGYFPANDPKYSCIVVVNNPSAGKIYGGAVAAPVFREIADRVYATRLDIHDGKIEPDTTEPVTPKPYGLAYYEDYALLVKQMGFASYPRFYGTDWIYQKIEDEDTTLSTAHLSDTLMPDLTGMGLRDAVYLLERLGLNPVFTGRGQVASQSVMPGSLMLKGTTVELTLMNL
ncbi:MAG: transpeptidase family protein [Bacteroidales bacterium]|nr:transpeptidase family protein [Bacteroidales bacterium]